jgi:phosphoserine phosphatase
MIVLFDLDSTLVSVEGIDLIAEWKGVGAEVAAITEKTMNGEADFEEAFTGKINTVSPSLSDLKRLGEVYKQSYTPGAQKLIYQFIEDGHEVGIVTGGFHEAALIVAEDLEIEADMVFANKLQFDSKGNYIKLMPTELTTNTGKLEVCKRINKDSSEKSIVFIGDSFSDLEVLPAVDLFIGFGGVAVREKVRQRVEHYAHSFAEVKSVINRSGLV